MQVRGFHLIYSKTWSSALSITSKKNPHFQATKFCLLPVNWLSWVYNRNCSQSQPSWLSLTGNLSDNKDRTIPLEWDKTKCSRSQVFCLFLYQEQFWGRRKWTVHFKNKIKAKQQKQWTAFNWNNRNITMNTATETRIAFDSHQL